MKLQAILTLTIVLAGALLSLPASAQVYRWVDARGVTNYSDSPPGLKSTSRVLKVEDNLSVYTPDKALTEAVAAFRQRINSSRDLDQARLDADLLSQQRMQLAQANPCRYNYGDSNCNGTADAAYPYYPYLPVVGGVVRPPRPRAIGSFPMRPARIGSAGRGTLLR
jgi:hypothetical protein